MRRFFVFAFLFFACYVFSAEKQLEKASKSEDIVVIVTDFGEIDFALFKEEAPLNVENIMKLVKQGFYDGTTFHRVIPKFVIQGGDPNSKDNDPTNDGYGGPGYYIKDEISKNLKHLPGTVALAKARDNENGSQFYICLEKLDFLDGKYTIIGQVTKGMDVVEKIAQVKTGKNDRPIKNVVMRRVYLKEKEVKSEEKKDTSGQKQ
jgi:cyclophilin family peptidyl-prolyl cis-trans isomerase